MRHLHLTDRGTAPLFPGSNQFRLATIVRIAFAAALVVSATPLRAQEGSTKIPAKSSTSKPKASQTNTAPAKTSQPKPAPKPAANTSAQTVTPATASAQPSAPAPSNDSYNISATTALLDAPGSQTIGELKKATNVNVIARDRGWTRVRVEGWVPDSLLTPADTTYRAGLSAADLRADPTATRGMTVIWTVEFIALQTADPLRRGLADEEPYILARGPRSENALLYLVVPPSLMGTARALQPLEKIAVTARVRDGRSEPVGIPILDIQTIRRIR